MVQSGAGGVRGWSAFVEYERIADLYRQGRVLPQEVLDRWGDVVPHSLVLSKVTEVLEGTWTYAASADWIQLMRRADSMLTAAGH